MSDYVISGESPTDFTQEKFDEIGVECIGCTFYLDGVAHYDDLGKTISNEEFYESMIAGADTGTAAIAPGTYSDYFRKFLEDGKDLIHLTLTSGLSSTIEAAQLAAEELREQFPDRKIIILDSMCCSPGFGLLLQEMSLRRSEGWDIEKLAQWVKDNRLHMRHEFLSTDLKYYIKGGRVKPLAGFVGQLLGICPILTMDGEGHLIPYEKARSAKKGLRRLVERFEELADGGIEYSGKVMLCHSYCPELSEELIALICERFPNIDGNIESYCIGPTVGSHSGPGTVAVFFWGKERTV